ncbi:hypothetical protein K438DRAFT_1989788 [Mycena galopus ATCC 62051]|nr:hypothetical protein K438DRAFT_1989788 [Mycena galopus ATCC 62051]
MYLQDNRIGNNTAGPSLTTHEDIMMEDSFLEDNNGLGHLSPLPEPIPDAGSPPPEMETGAGRRKIRLPARYRDILPEVLEPAPPPPEDEPTTVVRSVRLIVRDKFTTAMNTFGLWREYFHRPTYDPDSLVSTSDLSNEFPGRATPLLPSPQPMQTPPATTSSINSSTALLMAWQNNGQTTKSAGQLDALVNDVILNPEFKPEELRGFKAARAEKQVEKEAAQLFPLLQNFQETSVDIEVPSGSSTIPPRTFSVPGLHYRRLISVIKEAFAGPFSRHFHLSPFKLWHKVRSTGAEIRVFTEIYNSDAFIKEHDNVRLHGALPEDALDCKLEKVIAALMFWSDSTHLANFGNAKLWPIYMLFGNLSKYLRVKPGAEHHVAYIPSLPDSIQDQLSSFHVKWATQKAEILTHCRRELMHAVWKFLLDDEFVHAYKYGIVIRCADGIERRVYPRLFTYSADYPEKVLLATIRDGGLCPCPRCLISKTELHLMGYARDLSARVSTKVRKYLTRIISRAREFIYKSGNGIGSANVNGLLKETSSVPTFNAFIERLGDDFNLHQMLVVDFMHEFELGVWKNLFTHLIRLLHAQKDGEKLVAELDRRFGVDTIRRFASNASDMKKLGARDFEDLLQCAIPVFAGLFPEEHDRRVLKLLYRLAEWHAFAKLRMHTDPTLEHLRRLTPEIGRLMRDFKKTTCAAFQTFELRKEVAARGRREIRAAQDRAVAEGLPAPNIPPSVSAPSKKQKTLNLNTYKWHALGDYIITILLFGPTDAYSTQLGESLHRLVKRLYGITNKREHAGQIARKVVRMARSKVLMQSMAHKLSKKMQLLPPSADSKRKRMREPRRMQRLAPQPYEDPFGFAGVDVHYCISNIRRRPVSLSSFNPKNGDPAMKDFIPKLRDHLLGRLLHREFDGDSHDEFSADDRNTIRIKDDKLYETKLLRIHYTTYDVRRDQDVLKSGADGFVMVRSPETESTAHPYWYAQILGVFNATVFRVIPGEGKTPAVQMDFLWVRWMGVEPGYRAGIHSARLPKVGFVPESDEYAFGFLDPGQVIRGSHLIPNFAGGRTNLLLSTVNKTAARSENDTEDWETYYVNIFADRDMLMRYVGGGIGHLDVQSLSGMDIEMQEDGDDGPVGDGDIDSDDENNGSDSSEEEEEGELGEGEEEDEFEDDAQAIEDAEEDEEMPDVGSDDDFAQF